MRSKVESALQVASRLQAHEFATEDTEKARRTQSRSVPSVVRCGPSLERRRRQAWRPQPPVTLTCAFAARPAPSTTLTR